MANQRGDVLMTWARYTSGVGTMGFVRRTSPVLRTRTLHFAGVPEVAIADDGNFVVVWVAGTRGGTRVFGQRFNADGSKRGPEFNAATSSKGNHTRPAVAMNPATGELVVTWEVRDADGNGLGVFGQRFGFFTGRQGSEFAIYVPARSERPDSVHPFAAAVARAADNRFAVVWKTGRFAVLGQRYGPAGAPVGERLEIGEEGSLPDGVPQIAMASRGDFVVSWDDGGSSPLWFRLFRRDGTPAGPILSQETVGGFPYFGAARLAFGRNGTFALGWTNFADEGDIGWNILFQRFAASPADELCLFRNGHFHCDTGRTGGAPEVNHLFATSGGTPLLGDVDGDGRDDTCLVNGARFDCDSGHNFGAPETSFDFGQAGDTPLLGDVDGNGQADPCVVRNLQFLCDTAHDGGGAEIEISFGTAGETPLLGDIDGDGRADPCMASTGGVFRCDTAHDGGPEEAVFTLTGSGVPLIGNLDGL